MVLGNRLRHLRECKGFSHSELGKLSGESASLLMRVESGHAIPSMEGLERLAQALGVSVDLLFSERSAPALPNLCDRLKAEDLVASSLRKAHDSPGKID